MPPTPSTRPILVTGSAGFIGAHVVKRLLADGQHVVGVDNLNAYYDPALKRARLAWIGDHERFTQLEGDLACPETVEALFAQHQPARVVHLAAQPGVRYGAINPHSYVASNVTGMLHVLEGCRRHGVTHLVFASSSSVYGASRQLPYAEQGSTDHPLSLYAATKKAGEMMAHSYAHLYGIPCTGLRFFTVYGPWGRPDMAPVLFAKAIVAGEPIKVFNRGHHSRSFTYVDDIVEGLVRVLARPPAADTAWDAASPVPDRSGVAPYRLYNIGSPTNVALLEFIGALEAALGRKARLELLPMQRGDVADTATDVSSLRAAVGYEPMTTLAVGVARFVAWFQAHYGR